MAKFPEPPRSLAAVAPDIATLPSGVQLWRVYETAGDYPVAWNDFRFFGPTNSRFDHHDLPAQQQGKGILYAAAHPLTSIAEFFQATRTIDRFANAPWLVAFQLGNPPPLLDLTGDWPTKAGASMAINSGPRPRARRWSQVIYASYPGVAGLLYASSMHANKASVAFYERAKAALPGAPSFNRALSDP